MRASFSKREEGSSSQERADPLEKVADHVASKRLEQYAACAVALKKKRKWVLHSKKGEKKSRVGKRKNGSVKQLKRFGEEPRRSREKEGSGPGGSKKTCLYSEEKRIYLGKDRA